MRNHNPKSRFSRRRAPRQALTVVVLAFAFLAALAAAPGARAQTSNQTPNQTSNMNDPNSRYARDSGRSSSRMSPGNNQQNQQQNQNSNPFSRSGQNNSGTGSSSSRSRSSRNRDASGKNTDASGGRRSRKSKKDASKTKEATGAATGGQVPGRATPQDKSALAGQRRKILGQQKGPGKGKEKAAAALPTFAFSPLITTPTLYFSPGEARTEPNRRFATPCFFFNPEQKPIDSVNLWMRYPTDLIEAVGVDTGALKAAGGNVKREAAPDGYVRVSARFDPPLKQIIVPLGVAQWRAFGELGAGAIRFESPAGAAPKGAAGGVGVFCEGANLIDNSEIGNVGLASLNFHIGAPEAEDDGGDDAPVRVAAFEQPPGILDPSSHAGVSLALNPREEAISPGGTSTMDVALLNPSRVKFDELRFRIRFDPAEVEILDADENNAVTAGVNIYDGGFRRAMPFDVRATNRVDQASGEIEYKAFNSGGVYAYPTGTVARIAFRLKPGAESATFWFEGSNPTSGGMLSDARALGASVLGNGDGRPADALYNARVLAADRF